MTFENLIRANELHERAKILNRYLGFLDTNPSYFGISDILEPLLSEETKEKVKELFVNDLKKKKDENIAEFDSL
jgi:hypothetical protein